MPAEYTYKARDQKAGMDLYELDDALKEFPGADTKGKYRLKAKVGLKGQLQSLTFTEVDHGAEAATAS